MSVLLDIVLLDIERFQKQHFETMNNWRTWSGKGDKNQTPIHTMIMPVHKN